MGNIHGNNSRSFMVYFDPMLCSKSSEIKCRVFYKDAQGKLLNTEMKPKRIEVAFPILKTDSDINIGILRELVASLPFRDSKVYRINSYLDAETLMNICHEMVQRHDIKHIRTLKTKDGKNYETWYRGKAKVNSHDIVLNITISKDTDSIELFGALQTTESLVSMLTEFGHELSTELKTNTRGKSDLNQIVNVTIKDSIQRTESMTNFCPSCGTKLTMGVNFCSECGTKVTQTL
jgi:hypothetical protein